MWQFVSYSPRETLDLGIVSVSYTHLVLFMPRVFSVMIRLELWEVSIWITAVCSCILSVVCLCIKRKPCLLYTSHVAIYIGNGQVVHASSPRTGIKISGACYRNPVKVVRVLQD